MNIPSIWRLGVAFLLVSWSVCRAAASPIPQVFDCDGKALAAAKDRYDAADSQTVRIVNHLVEQADEFLPDGPYTIVRKTPLLPGIDPHEYISLAPYFWPNPDTADGLPYVRHDGRRNPETKDFDSPIMGRFCSHVYTLALAGYFTGEPK